VVLDVLEPWWASGPIWTGTEHIAPPEFQPRTAKPIGSSWFYPPPPPKKKKLRVLL